MKVTKHNLPTWAASALINGDYSGIGSLGDMALVKAFDEKYHNSLMSCEDETFFSSSPAFGLPCECVTLTVIANEVEP